MKHVISFNESEDILGDLRELGYKDLVGKTILYMNDNFIGWHMIVMRPSEEEKAAHAILNWYGIKDFKDKRNRPIKTIQEAMSFLADLERVTFFTISEELEVNPSVTTPHIVCMTGFNPFEVTKQLTNLYKGNLWDKLDLEFMEEEKEIIEL